VGLLIRRPSLSLAAVLFVTALGLALAFPRTDWEGTVWLALAGPGGILSRAARYRGDRGQVRLQSAYGALQLLREALGHGARSS